MPGPLVTSKYRLPGVWPGVVARRRLVDRLAAVPLASLTVVSAPAGFGKTTVLGQWLEQWLSTEAAGGAAAWLSLDRRDNDPTVFWTYVITAVQAAAPGTGADALAALASSGMSGDAALTSLVNDLDALPHDLVLVLDDYHLIETPEVHAGITYLLDHQPRQLHLVLATRVDPPLPVARLRGRGRLVELRAADLRFTGAEAAAYLNGAMHLDVGADDVAALEERTEGWIAALQLAALSMRGREDISSFVAGFAGDDRYVVDYLAEEVLGRQPPAVTDFLLRTSILERLTGSLCDAVTARPGGAATLVALERANLFLVPLDDRREWYRYHHLFADVLQAHARERRPDELPTLHRRAAEWFADRGDTSQAITHALAAGDTARAAALMELAMPLMRRERRETELARWVRALPQEVLRDRPVLDVAFVGALAQSAEFATVDERLDRIDAALRSADGSWPRTPPPEVTVVDADGYRSLPAHIAMYRAAAALARGDLAATTTHARTALSLAPRDDALARAAAGALAGIAAWTIGDLDGAHAAYVESVAGLTSVGFLADVLGCTITLGDLRRTQGRLGSALMTYRHALELTASAPGEAPLRGSADMHVGMAGVLLERGDLAGARHQLERSRRLGDHNGLPQNPYRWRVVLAGICAAEGDLDAALDLLDAAERVYAGDYAPDVRPVAAVRARMYLRRGEPARALEWAQERRLSVADSPSYLREYEHLTLVRLLLARHRVTPDAHVLADVHRLLQRLLAAAEAGGRGASVLDVLVLQALAHDAGRDRFAALGVLAGAVTLAEPEGSVRVFADEGAPLAALLQALRRHPSASAFVARLLAAATTVESGAPAAVSGATAAPAAGRSASGAPRVLIEALSGREQDVLRLLGGDLDGPDIARQLFVSVNTLRTHTRSIYSKLGVHDRRAAVRRARDLDLLPGRRP